MVKPDPAKNRRISCSALMRRADISQLVLMTDRHRLPDPCAVMAQLPRGSWVIFRDYDAPDRTALAARLQRTAHQLHHRFIVAGDIRLARRIKADGVHMPDFMLRQKRKNLQYFQLVTASCHSRQSLRRAKAIGVDAVLVSPVFMTGSHPDAHALGVHRFARLIKHTGCPVIALGGVQMSTAGVLSGLGLLGIAGITGLAPDQSIGQA